MNQTEKKKPGMMLYFQDAEIICSLPDGQLASLLRAMLAYARDGVLPDFGGDELLAFAWQFLKRSLDADDARYNDIKRKRSEAGRQGNRIRWQTSQNMAMQSSE